MGKTTAMTRDRFCGLVIGATVMFAGATAGAVPAHAQPDHPSGGAWVESHPNPAEPGGQVIVIGSCGDVDVDAVFESLAFAGSRKVPADIDGHTGQATAHVRIPQGMRANDYNVNLFCAGTEQATTSLTVKEGSGKSKPERHHPTKGPRTGGGGTASGATPSGDDARTPLLLAGGLVGVGGVALLLFRRRRRS